MVARPSASLFEEAEPDASGRADGRPDGPAAGDAPDAVPRPGLGFAPLQRGAHRWRPVESAAVAAVALIVVVRVVVAALTQPASTGEQRLVQALSAAVGPPGTEIPAAGLTEVLARAQLLGYVDLTGALDRHSALLGAVREPAVVACGVLLTALVVLGFRVRSSPVAVALGLALLACWGPAIAVLSSSGSGPAGVAWAAVGAVSLTWRHGAARSAGVLAIMVAIGTAPLLAAPVAVAVAVSTARRWVPTAEVALALGAAAPVLVLLSDAPPVDADPGRAALLVVGTVVVAAGLAGAYPQRALRLPAAVAAAILVLVALPWSASGLLLPAMVVSVVVLAAAGLDVLVGLAGPAVRRGRALLVPAVLVGCALAATLLVSGPPPVADDAPRRALAAWIVSATDRTTTVSVPDEVRPDLLRAGIPAARLVPDGVVVVRSGPAPVAGVLARFGEGDDALTVAAADPAVAAAPASERLLRAGAGAQLVGNPALAVPPDVAELLRSGAVDTRALAVLGGLTGRGPVTVTAFPPVPGDDPGLPRHQVTLAAADASTLAWLAAQQPPFRPGVATTPDGTTLTWPVPGPTALLGG